jgi:hypothetical protein
LSGPAAHTFLLGCAPQMGCFMVGFSDVHAATALALPQFVSIRSPGTAPYRCSYKGSHHGDILGNGLLLCTLPFRAAPLPLHVTLGSGLTSG